MFVVILSYSAALIKATENGFLTKFVMNAKSLTFTVRVPGRIRFKEIKGILCQSMPIELCNANTVIFLLINQKENA